MILAKDSIRCGRGLGGNRKVNSAGATAWRSAVRAVGERLFLPEVDEKALTGLKYNAALPKELSTRILAGRIADLEGSALVLAEPQRFVSS